MVIPNFRDDIKSHISLSRGITVTNFAEGDRLIDDLTGYRIQIDRDGTAGPYIIVSHSQADRVRNLFNQGGVTFTENPSSLSENLVII